MAMENKICEEVEMLESEVEMLENEVEMISNEIKTKQNRSKIIEMPENCVVEEKQEKKSEMKEEEKKEFFPRWFNNTVVDIQKIFKRIQSVYNTRGCVLQIVYDKKNPKFINGYIISLGEEEAGYYSFSHMFKKRLKVTSIVKNIDEPEMHVDKPSLAAVAKHFMQEEFPLLPGKWLYQVCLTLASGNPITRNHIIKFPEWINLASKFKNDYELIDELYKLVSYRRRPGYKQFGGLDALRRFSDLAEAK
jgi:hypothetical protein